MKRLAFVLFSLTLFLAVQAATAVAEGQYPQHSCLDIDYSLGRTFELASPGWSWSRDGAHIIYARASGQKFQLRLLDIESREFHCLTDGRFNDHSPYWSRVRDEVVFLSDRDGTENVYLLDLGSGHLRQLTRGALGHRDPVFSPDGGQIAVVRDEPGGNNRVRAIWVMRRDGSNPRKLYIAPFGLNHLSWSLDGSKIHFFSIEDSRWNNLLEVDVASGEAKRITFNTVTDSYSPVPLPDGSGFSISQGMEESPYNQFVNYDLLKIDGRSLATERLTWTWGSDDRQQFSPDGKRFGFASRRTGYSQLYVTDADRTNLRQLTFQPDTELSRRVETRGIKEGQRFFDDIRSRYPDIEVISDWAGERLADIFIGRGDLNAALMLAEMMVESLPHSARALRVRAYILLQQGNVAAAEADYRSSMMKEANVLDILAQLGTGDYIRIGDSVPDFWRLQRNSVLTLTYRLLRVGNAKGALQLANRLTQKNPEFVDGFVLKGEVHMMSGDYRRASAAFQEALALEPDNAFATHHLSRLSTMTAEQPF